MKTKPLNIRVILFFILLAIINIILIFGWLNIKITPSLSKIDEFKVSVSNELRKDYSNIDELINNLDIKNTSYFLISQYFFKKIKNLNFLEYETEKFISKISRDEYHF